MSNNFIRVLRNTALCANHEDAIKKLQGKLAYLQDGEICIASYGPNWGEAKTILGVVRVKTVDNVTKRSYTIFDNEDIAGIVAKIQELDATVRGNLNENDVVETDKHVGVKVVEADGKLTEVTVVESDIASAKLLGTKDDTKDADTAFGRIKAEAAARDTAITKALDGLDGSVAATATPDNKVYSVLTGVTQANGKLAGKTEVTLAAVAKTGLASDVATTAIGGDTTHVAVAGTNVSDQITDIAATLKGVQNSIAEAKENDLKYTTHKLSETEVTALGDVNVKEAYQIFAYTGTWNATGNKGTQVGETIKIYKDSAIKEIYLGSEADTIDKTLGKITKVTPTEANLRLNYAYMKADGTYEMVKIDVANFLRESEFGNGLQVNSGKVSVKVAEGSESFLTVDGNGVKISGVQNAIDTAIAALDTTVTSNNNGNVSVTVAQTDGKVSGVTVTTTGLALDNAVVKNVTVNGVNATVENNKATVTIDGTDVTVANSTETYDPTVYSAPFEGKVGTNHIATGDTVAAAFKKTENTISVLADEVIANEKVTTTAVSKLAESTGVVATDGAIKYTPKKGANYIGEATSVHDATVKLDAAIKTVADTALTGVEGSQAITVSGGKTVSLKLDAVKTDNALTITTDGLYLSNVWDCGEY